MTTENREPSENQTRNPITEFVLNNIPVGVVIFRPGPEVVYSNSEASTLISKCNFSRDVEAITNRIFEAMHTSRLKELFPDDMLLFNDACPRCNCTLRFHFQEKPEPLVGVFIHEESLCNKIDISKIQTRFGLTPRETDIFRHVCNGLNNADIAMMCGIAEQTVKDHLSNIYAKLKVRNRFSLMRLLASYPLPG